MTCDRPQGSHEVNRLRAWLAERLPPDAYPPGGLPVTEPFHGTAFFTAGPGLIVGDREDPSPPPWPEPGTAVMFIGNNVDSVGGFEKRRRRDTPHGDRSDPMETWEGVFQLLKLTRLDERRCFFTNCFVGLVDAPSAEGPHPAAGDPAFGSLCWEFLQLQFEVLQPAAAVILGKHARNFLVKHIDELSPWRGRSLKSVTPDGPDPTLRARVGHREIPFALIYHPSNYVARSGLMKGWRGVDDFSVEAELVSLALSS